MKAGTPRVPTAVGLPPPPNPARDRGLRYLEAAFQAWRYDLPRKSRLRAFLNGEREVRR